MKTSNSNRICHFYGRTSRDHTEGINRQNRAYKEALAANGWTQGRAYSNKGTSGFRGKHRKPTANGIPGFGNLLADIANGTIAAGEMIWIEDVDRMSREDIDPALQQIRGILLADVDVYSNMTRRLYTKDSLNSPMDLLELIWRMYLAAEESKKKSVRSTDNHKVRRKAIAEGTAVYKKEGVNRCLPGWLAVQSGKLVPVPERVATVKLIFSLAIAGKGSRLIVKELNKRHVPAWRTKWTERQVQRLLKDQRLIDVVGEDVFNQAVACRKAGNKPGRADSDHVNLFAGLFFHKTHDCTMFSLERKGGAKKQYSYRYYVSTDGFMHRDGKKMDSVRADVLEKVVLQFLNEIDYSALGQDNSHKIEIEAAVGRLALVEQQVADLLCEIKKGAGVKALAIVLGDLETEATALADRIRDLRGQAASKVTPEALAGLLASGDKDTRLKLRQMVRMAIQRIDYVPAETEFTLTVVLRSGEVRQIVADRKTGQFLQVVLPQVTVDRYQSEKVVIVRLKIA